MPKPSDLRSRTEPAAPAPATVTAPEAVAVIEPAAPAPNHGERFQNQLKANSEHAAREGQKHAARYRVLAGWLRAQLRKPVVTHGELIAHGHRNVNALLNAQYKGTPCPLIEAIPE